MQEGHIPLLYCMSDLLIQLHGMSEKFLLPLLKQEYLKELLECNGEES